MPMYEKGSVRAEPRSKQQERMKKIMKKFLSSLLALTMILSLVIVPANAATTNRTLSPWSVDLSDETGNLTKSFTVDEVADAGYQWSLEGENSTSVAEIASGATSNSASIRAKGAGTATLKCVVTPQGGGDTITYTASITVTDYANSFTAAKVNDFTFSERTYTAAQVATVSYFEGETFTASSFTTSLKDTTNYYGLTCTYSGNESSGTITVSAKTKVGDKSVHFDISVTPNKVTLNTPAISDNGNTIHQGTIESVSSNYIREGEKGSLKATYNSVLSSSRVSYQWYKATGSKIANGTDSTVDLSNLPTGVYNITVEVTDGGHKVTSEAYRLVVIPDTHSVQPDYSDTTMVTGESQLLKLTVKDGKTTNTNPTLSTEWSVESDKNSYISLSDKTNKQATATAGSTSGRVTVTAVVTYLNKDYTVEFPIKIEALDDTIASVTNGDSNSYDDSELESLVTKIIKKKDSSFTASKIQKITLETAPSTMLELYDRNSFTSSHKYSKGDTISDLYISAKAGYLGEDSFQLKVYSTQNGVSPYIVTLKVPVVGDKDIKDTVTGTAAGKSVTFTNSDYKYLYYTTSKVTDHTGHFDGTSVSGYTLVKEDKDVTVTASQFGNNNSVTLYVVGVDKDGVASTGTITVSQKSYDINYNVVAGKSVNFDQKAFEDFLEDYAEDNDDYNPRKDEITFDHAVLTSSIPSAKSEGTLYYGSTEITSSNKSKTDMTDMDKVSFDSVSKPSKDTVSLTFRVYGEIEKPNSRKPDKVNYDVNVVISVVKEDITYTVGIDDTVQMTARDFVNFLQDAKTSYRKAELDYVKFDVSGKNVSSYAYGGLYRSYSSYSTGKLADSTDKFYYEPSRTQYDLADVAYHTTRWAEAGKTVYIPFTVYGTKNEEASGTMAITIAQTMNFIDVKASDFFYESVKWAVNNKITNGTSSTTFSPYKNCNRAEIVTFLWRAAGSPEPTVTRNPFTDVNSVRDASYYKAILWASQKGITAGTNATTFSPYQECTRSQIVTFLYRYAGKPSGYYSNPFKDVSSVNEASYYNAILWAVGKGITQGTSTTTFSPYASCTRGEAVTFLYRYVNGVK